MFFGLSDRILIFGALSAVFLGYSVYVYSAGTARPGPRASSGAALSPEVRAGYQLFQDKNCIACHQLYGLGGYMGPDLTNVAVAPEKGLDYARVFLEFGSDRMPDYGLSEAEVGSLLAFLEYTAASGDYPPRAPILKWNGTVDYAGRGDRP